MNPMIHGLALGNSAATLLLIVAGGLVTTTGAGLAVPDWPTTFGYNPFFFPWSGMVGAVLIEHSHRLLGAVVGILTLALAAAAWVGRCDRPLRALAVAAVALVCVQGLLGGLRVVLRQDALAVVHGCLAQGFFVLTAVLATVTGPEWNRPLSAGDATRLAGVTRFADGVATLLFAQVVLGALTTHAGWFAAHLSGAVVAVTGTGALVAAALWRARALAPIRWRARVIGGLLVIQVGLGLGAFLARFTGVAVPGGELAVIGLPVAHRAVSALLLGLVVTLALHAWRLAPAGVGVGQTLRQETQRSRDPGQERLTVAS
jgi:cytochrome c oxidase assembly protein subunit 15